MILDTIVATKKEEVARLKTEGIHPPAERQKPIDPPRGFRKALLAYPGVSIIAEAKKASPSQGVICSDFQIETIVENYQRGGAQALSVLTDQQYFQGSLDYLVRSREISSLPVLRKDFIIDEIQIREAAVYGADAVLLIAAILDRDRIQEFFHSAKSLGMDVLAEVHNEEELRKVLETDCDLIGINNRNLNDFSVDIGTTFRLLKLIPASIPVVSESGLKSSEDLKRLQENGVCAALIGETLMRAGTRDDSIGLLR